LEYAAAKASCNVSAEPFHGNRIDATEKEKTTQAVLERTPMLGIKLTSQFYLF
jgi:hypothetical protein